MRVVRIWVYFQLMEVVVEVHVEVVLGLDEQNVVSKLHDL